MTNHNIAIMLQHEHEDELDNIKSDVSLAKRVKEIALKEYSVSDKNASAVSREVLNLYAEVE